jgi:Tfp pilus assembly protein PilO
MKVPPRYVALVALLIAVPVSAWAVAYRPVNNAVRFVAEEIRSQTGKLTNYGEINSQYREMKQIMDMLQEANEEAAKKIPITHNAEQWLESVSDAALSFGLVVQSVTNSGEREEGEYSILPVDFKVTGEFSSLYKLLLHLEQMTRLSRIDTMSVHRIDDNTIEARIVIQLVFSNGGVN